jgi:hypothetical protein
VNTQKKVLAAILAASLLTSFATTAVAQTANTGTGDGSVVADRDDDGFDWGLLGLLGLLGLIPRKRHDVHHDTTRTTR